MVSTAPGAFCMSFACSSRVNMGFTSGTPFSSHSLKTFNGVFYDVHNKMHKHEDVTFFKYCSAYLILCSM